MKAVINMTNETQEIMALFAKLVQSRYFVASAWMTVGKERRRDFMNTKGKSRLLNLLAAKDGLTNAEITELLDIRPSSVSLQVKALEEDAMLHAKHQQQINAFPSFSLRIKDGTQSKKVIWKLINYQKQFWLA